jgi:hypothetical protein
VVTVDVQSCCQSSELIGRKIWQELFKFYQVNGDLTRMDSFLCDLSIITNIIKEVQKYQGNEAYFFWECDKWYTEITDYPFDNCIKVTYFREAQKFTVEQL